MITIPALSGAVLAGWKPIHLPLLLFWWVGYLAFQAGALWLKSHRRARYLPAARTYALIALSLGLLVLALRPSLAFWAVAYAPLLGVASWAVMTRRERGLLNDTATVLAACLMLLVTFSAAAPRADARWALAVAAIEFAYFWGTIPHVKALIRERTNPAYHAFSAVYHAVGAAVVGIAAARGALAPAPLGGWLLTAVWVGLAVRAGWMPAHQRRTAPMRPLAIGLTEVVFSLLVAAALLA